MAAIALYRPGPMDYIPTYNARMHGNEPITYHHEKMQPFLEETFGIMVFQERVIQIASELFGYEPGEADLMRKAISKKNETQLRLHRSNFLERGPQNGIDEATSAKVFADIEFFANYGFNKAHAADYAVITVQTAFLKTNYPYEFMTAMLSVHSNEHDKISQLLFECKQRGIEVLPPDVNKSELDFDIQGVPDSKKRSIRFGLSAVKNVNSASLRWILDGRSDGEFNNLSDFCKKVDLRQVPKRTMENLIRVGVFDELSDRISLLASVGNLIQMSSAYHRDAEIGQTNLFGEFNSDMEIQLDAVETQSIDQRQLLRWEKELLGVYVTGRPVERYLPAIAKVNPNIILDLFRSGIKGQDVRVAGEILAMRRVTTRNEQTMYVMQLECWHDSAETIELVIFPRVWQQIDRQFTDSEGALKTGDIVIVKGRFEAGRGNGSGNQIQNSTDSISDLNRDMQIIVETIRRDLTILDHDEVNLEFRNGTESVETRVKNKSSGRLKIKMLLTENTNQNENRLRKVNEILRSYEGSDSYSIQLQWGSHQQELRFANIQTRICDELLNELAQYVGQGNLVVEDEQDTRVM